MVDDFLGEYGVTGFASPLDPDGFNESLTIAMDTSFRPITVEEVFEYNTNPPPALEGYKKVDTQRLLINGVQAIEHVSTWGSEERTVQLMMVFIAKANTYWLLTFTTRPMYWDEYESIFDKIAGSFEILR